MSKLLNKINNSFFSDSLTTIIGSGIGKFLSLVSTLIVAKILESEMYGIQSFFKSTITTVGFLAIFGLQLTITSYISKKTNKFETHQIISSSILFVLIASLFFSIIYTYVVFQSFDEEINNIILLFFLIFMGSTSLSLNLLFNGVLAGLGLFKHISFINFISGLFLISFLPFIAFKYSLSGILISFPFVLSLTTLLYLFILNSKNLLVLDFNFIELKNLLKTTLPVGLQEMCFPIYSFLLNYTIVFFLGNNFLGLYSASMNFYIMFLFVPGILRNVILKHFSIIENTSKTKQNEILKNSILLNLFLTIIPIVVFLYASEFFISMLGDSFLQVELLLIPMSIMAIIASISNPLYQYYIANDKNWKLFYFRFIRDLATLSAVFILLKSSFFTSSISLVSILYISSLTSAILFIMMLYEKKISG